MARFRFAPLQQCANLYIVDFIARLGLRRARQAGPDGVDEGWTWRFDPFLWRTMRFESAAPFLQAAKCPLALIRGGASRLMRVEDAAHMMALLSKGSPYLEIPNADHHVMVDQPLAFVAA